MTRLADVCHHIRSKNAGPFWITVDLFFRDTPLFERYAGHDALQPPALASLLDVDAAAIRRFPVPDLAVLKLSYPRPRPQGGAYERDMHGGQQYVRLLDIDLRNGPPRLVTVP